MFSPNGSWPETPTTPGGAPSSEPNYHLSGYEPDYDGLDPELIEDVDEYFEEVSERTEIFTKAEHGWGRPLSFSFTEPLPTITERVEAAPEPDIDPREVEAVERARALTIQAEAAADHEARLAGERAHRTGTFNASQYEEAIAEAAIMQEAQVLDSGPVAALFCDRRPSPTSGEMRALQSIPVEIDTEPSVRIRQDVLAEGTPRPEWDGSESTADMPWFVKSRQPTSTIAEQLSPRVAGGSGPNGFPILPQTLMTIPPEAVPPQPMLPFAVGTQEELTGEAINVRPKGLLRWVKSKLGR